MATSTDRHAGRQAVDSPVSWLVGHAGTLLLAAAVCVAVLAGGLVAAHPADASDGTVETVAYTVQPGDTLWSIAVRYDDVTVEDLKAANGMDGAQLTAGQRLLIPR